MKIKLYKNRNNLTSIFRFKPLENPDKREQDFLHSRGEFGVSYAIAFDKHLKRLREYGKMENLWMGKGEASHGM